MVYELYQDIKSRTNGDIYIGVVGPVRTGKSTFIKRVMDKLVLPNITDDNRKQRVIDEIPQSADGKIVMTTQPKFVPDAGITVNISPEVDINVRLVDCVGYLIDGVEGDERNVRTPWSSNEMTFAAASELGTRKVMAEHSTIGVVVTTDGTIADFDRANYVDAESRIVAEMKELGKPFVILLNSLRPTDEKAISLAKHLSETYNTPVICKDVLNMELDDINEILECILSEFPLVSINVETPRWLQMLPFEHPIIKHIGNCLMAKIETVNKINDYKSLLDLFAEDEFIKPIKYCKANYGNGVINVELTPQDSLFYNIMSEMCGVNILDESSLFKYIKSASVAEKEYSKLKTALDDVETRGYGIVLPSEDDVELATPIMGENVKGIKMQAKASCLHIMKVDVETEVSPMMGGGSQEMLEYLKKEYADKENELWNTMLFGKSLSVLAKENLNQKMYAMPQDAQAKLKRAVTRIVNEGKGGVLCILL